MVKCRNQLIFLNLDINYKCAAKVESKIQAFFTCKRSFFFVKREHILAVSQAKSKFFSSFVTKKKVLKNAEDVFFLQKNIVRRKREFFWSKAYCKTPK